MKSNLLLLFAVLLNCLGIIANAQNPNWVWAKQCGSNTTLTHLDLDRQENLYATGSFSGTSVFGSDALTGAGQFVIKINNNGIVQWASQTTESNYGGNNLSVAADNNGNCYSSGQSFLVKYNASGAIDWGVSSSPNNGDNCAYGQGVVTDSYGNAYIAGNCFNSYGTLTLGPYTLNDANGTVVLAKIDSFGNIAWLKQQGKSFDGNCCLSWSKGIAIDKLNNIYVIGTYSSLTIFGNDTLATPSSGNIFLAKYDGGGNFKWIRTAGNASASTSVNAITVDNSGNPLIVGTFPNDLLFSNGSALTGSGTQSFIAKFDENGNYIWGQAFSLPIGDLTTDINNNIFLTGAFSGTVFIGGDTLIGGSTSSVFAAKLDSNGSYQYSRQTTASDNSGGAGIRVFNDDSIYVAGNYTGNVDFGVINLNSGSNNSSFISKVGGTCTPPTISITPQNASICSGGSQTITASGTGTGYSWSSGQTTAQITVNPTNSTTYTVTATNGSCSSTATVTVNINTSPSINILPGNATICAGNAVILTPSATGTAYAWSGPNNFTGNTASISVTAAGQYDVTVTDPSGCTGTFNASVNVASGTPPVISAGNNQTISSGQSVNLSATVSSGISPYSYSWSSNPAGFSSSQANPLVAPTVTTTYNLTVSETNGCAATASVTITVTGSSSSCDTSIHATVSLFGCSLAVQQFSGASYQWEFNGTPVSGETAPVYSVPQSGLYSCNVSIGSCVYYSNYINVVYNQGSCTSGIPELNAFSSFVISPNPSTGQFTLSFEGQASDNTSLKILNPLGQLILNESFDKFNGKLSKQINLQNVSSGVYILLLTAGDQTISRKIIVD